MTPGKTDFETRGAIAIAWIENPDKGNALSLEVLRDLAKILDIVEQDQKLPFLIISSRGGNFSTGFDMTIVQDRHALREGFELFARVLFQIERLPLPVLAAVRGAAFGAGFELALACDLIIASETATFCFPEANMGACALFGAIRLPQLVGKLKAKEIMMTCRKIPAPEAAGIGLVNKVVADRELLDSAISLAQEISGKGASAIQMIKFSMNRESGISDLAYLRGADLSTRAFEDFQKGVNLFFQNKKPRCKGK